MSIDTSPRLLLISPPWRTPYGASLALATLRPLLRRHGLLCDELHGTLLMPLTASSLDLLEQYSSYLFAPSLYPQIDRERMVDRMLRRYIHSNNIDGVLYPEAEATADRFDIRLDDVRRAFLADLDRAQTCVERMLQAALRPEYDIVGFSATFEGQLPAALAVAKQLKALRPDVKIILGGASCFENQGDGLTASFPFLDAVCHTEGEAVIVPLLSALRGAGSLQDVPGIAYRDASGVVWHNPSPPQLSDLDTLPIPEYEPFLEQYQRSPWATLFPPKYFFETSRGCWWGQKHLCTFCGLNAEGLTFRRKSPTRAFEEIRHLYERYRAKYLQATDNILDMGYLKNVMPQLAAMPKDPDRPLEIFFEIKSNLRRDQVMALADGGVVDVQPGIESFSDGVLKLMDKGATGLGQIQFIKWALESGIGVVYNLIIRNPGEQAAWYRDMADLLPSLVHLPPPSGMVAMHLERFSPYHSRPEKFGIRNIRPMPYYRDIYPDPQVDLDRIAYVFQYDHDFFADADLLAAQRQCAQWVDHWKKTWKSQPASYVEREGTVVITDHRQGSTQRSAVLRGPGAQIFRYLDQVRSIDSICDHFSHIDRTLLQTLLSTWLHHRYIARSGDRYLSVLPCRERRPIEPRDETAAAATRKSGTARTRLPLLAGPTS